MYYPGHYRVPCKVFGKKCLKLYQQRIHWLNTHEKKSKKLFNFVNCPTKCWNNFVNHGETICIVSLGHYQGSCKGF